MAYKLGETTVTVSATIGGACNTNRDGIPAYPAPGGVIQSVSGEAEIQFTAAGGWFTAEADVFAGEILEYGFGPPSPYWRTINLHAPCFEAEGFYSAGHYGD